MEFVHTKLNLYFCFRNINSPMKFISLKLNPESAFVSHTTNSGICKFCNLSLGKVSIKTFYNTIQSRL